MRSGLLSGQAFQLGDQVGQQRGGVLGQAHHVAHQALDLGRLGKRAQVQADHGAVDPGTGLGDGLGDRLVGRAGWFVGAHRGVCILSWRAASSSRASSMTASTSPRFTGFSTWLKRPVSGVSACNSPFSYNAQISRP